MFAAAASGGCERLCPTINTPEKAIEASRKYLLSDGMEALRKRGIDASFFDGSERGGATCDGPMRFHYTSIEDLVIWQELSPGNCEGCWDTTNVITRVASCGRVAVLSIETRPFISYRDVMEDQAKGKPPCRPRNWKAN